MLEVCAGGSVCSRSIVTVLFHCLLTGGTRHFSPCGHANLTSVHATSAWGICVVSCFRCSPPFGKWGLWGVLRPAASSICNQVHTGSYWSWILMALQCNISPLSTLTCKYRPHSDSTVQLMWHVKHSKKPSHAMFRVILNMSCCYVSKPQNVGLVTEAWKVLVLEPCVSDCCTERENLSLDMLRGSVWFLMRLLYLRDSQG